MTKYVKLSAPVYGDCDSLHVYAEFDKNRGGYGIACIPVHRDAGMCSVNFGPEYCKLQKQMFEIVSWARRRSVKKQEVADQVLADQYLDYAARFLGRIGRSDLEIVGSN